VDRDFRSPARAPTVASTLQVDDPAAGGIRRRSTAVSRRSVVPRTLAGGRSKFTTLAGPSEDATPQLRLAQEPYVHPGYAELNPSYEQAPNARPVWSLAKPLPRVVRPGMVPTKSEIFEASVNAENPTENSQKLGLDVDPNDLEKGKVSFHPDPRKLAAQLKDSRAQRENNFIKSLQRRGTGALGGSTSGSGALSIAPSRTSQQIDRIRRSSTARRPMTPALEDVEGEEEEEKDWEEVEEPQDDQGGHEAFPRLSKESTRPSQGKQSLDYGSPTVGADSNLDAIPEGYEPSKGSDTESMSTLQFESDPNFIEDLDPLVEHYIEEEVHNNHTAWSVVRTHHREFLAELLAVIIQLTYGFSADLASTVSNGGSVAPAWGIATMSAIYISGGISGAHLNPVITMMLWFYRGFPKRKMPEYFLAQFLGAFIAGYVAYGVYTNSINEYLTTHDAQGIINSFVTNQRSPYITPVTAFFNEFIGTAFLSAIVLALGDDQNAPPGAGMNAFIIGLVISLGTYTFAQQTGAALNPSRDFGPRLALLSLGYGSELFTNPYWFYGPWAGALSGAFFGAALYDTCIFTGGESPINYPWTRTKRSFKKGKKKWARRLRLAKKEVEQEVNPFQTAERASHEQA